MSRIKHNMVANYVGRFWTALIGLAFIPLYIRFMGIEAYGLVGLFATFQSVLSLLDLGLGTTMNREMARRSAHPDKSQETRDLVRTLEVIYWLIAVIIGTLLVSLSSFIGHRWIKADRLDPSTVQHAVMIMGALMAARWPLAFYMGGLNGLQRQVLRNAITIGEVTIRAVGSVLVLWLISPTILAFFSWQLVVSAVHTSLMAFFLWRSLPGATSRPHFRKSLLLTVWRFAAGLSAISIVSILLTQTDKILLSALLSLEEFAYYTLAWVVAINVYVMVIPLFETFFPHFSLLVDTNNGEMLKQRYHQASQFAAVLLFPVVLVLVFFPREVLLVWTGDIAIAKNVSGLLSLLAIAAGIGGLNHFPYALQLAHGRIKITLYANTIACILLVPMIYWATTRHAAFGAAVVRLILSLGTLFVVIPVVHHCLLRGEQLRWYCQDIGIPLLACLLPIAVGRWLIPPELQRFQTAIFLAILGVSSIAASMLSAPRVRIWFFQQLQRTGKRAAHQL